MSKALLVVPHFWDPVCVPLGISSLKAYAEAHGHSVDLFDFNTVPEVFAAQRAYFSECKAQFPYFQAWNIERNGTEMLAIHQIIYLYSRNRPDYRELVAEVLNMDGRDTGEFLGRLNIARFDAIFASLYARVSSILNRLLRGQQYDVVGCSLFNSTWPATLFLLKRAKSMIPHVRTVVGGPGPMMGITSRADEVAQFMNHHDFIDYFVIGEGEPPFIQILENPELPRGVVDPQRKLTLMDARKSFVKPEDMPAPDYGQLEIPRYLQLSVASSRGCPFECSFCAETVFWKGFRSFGPSRTFEQMDSLAQKYNRRSFYLCDSLSNTTIDTLTSDIRKNNRHYTIDCYLRADKTVSDGPKVASWRDGGLVRSRLGMESASQRILDAMVKKTTPEQMERSLEVLAAAGVITSTLWIVCYPGETEDEFAETLRFIRSNRQRIYQADAWLFQYHPEGLAHSGQIESERGSRLRYSDPVNEVLAVTPYVVDHDFTPAERFERLERFVHAMTELEIPNPYSVYEWVAAKGRWESMGRESHWSVEASMMALNA